MWKQDRGARAGRAPGTWSMLEHRDRLSAMLERDRFSKTRLMLLAGLLASGVFVPAMGAERAAPGTKPTAARTRYKPDRFAGRAGMYYQGVWGVDSLTVRLAESGEVVRF